MDWRIVVVWVVGSVVVSLLVGACIASGRGHEATDMDPDGRDGGGSWDRERGAASDLRSFARATREARARALGHPPSEIARVSRVVDGRWGAQRSPDEAA